MRILIVADAPVPHPYMNYRAEPLARYLSAKGHDVSVLCAKPIMSSGGRLDDFRDISFTYIPEYASVHDKSGLPKRMYQLLLMIKKLRDLFKRERFDIIRPISFMPAWAVSLSTQKFDCPVITNMSDFYSDLYQQFNLPMSSFVSKIIRRVERDIIRKSDVFIVDSPTQRQYWKNWSLNEKKCVVLPHGIPRSYDQMQYGPETDGVRIKSKYRIADNAKVVFYIGDISRLDGVDILIDAASIITKRYEQVKFMVIGTGTEKYMSTLKRQVVERKVERCFIFIPRIPHYEVPQHIGIADICVAPFRLTPTSDSSVPNKILEYIAMKKPVVATAGRGIRETFGDVIKYVEPEDPQMLAEAVLDVLNDNSYGDRIRKKMDVIVSKLDWRNIVEREELVMNAAINHEIRDFSILDYRLCE